MTTWHRAAAPGEMQDGSVKQVEAGGATIALACQGGKYYALDNRCPHAGGPLSQGAVEGGMLVCPWHGREFDLASGQCESFTAVATYPVEAREDGIFVAVQGAEE